MTVDTGSPLPVPPRRTRVLRSVRALALDTTPLRQSRDYRFLFSAQAFGVFGDQMRIVAIPYMVFKLTNSSFMVGLVSLAQFAPALGFALAGGALADVMDRRTLLRTSQVFFVVLTALLAIPALFGLPPLWYIFMLATLLSGVQAVNNPTRRASIPRLVGNNLLANALALDQITFQLGTVFGPAVAGVLLGTLGVGPALLVNTLTALISLSNYLMIAPIPPLAQAADAKTGFAAIREGMSYLKNKPVVLSTFLIDVNATFFGGPKALFPALALQVFRVGPFGLGLLYVAPGAGALIGTLLTGWMGKVRHQGRAVVLAVCIWGAAIASFGLLSRVFWLALVMLAVAGMADMFSAVFRSTILQLATPDNLRGRLTSIHFIVVNSGPRLGDVEAGTVAALTTTQLSVVSGGIAALIGAVVLGFVMPAFMRYDAHKPLEPPT
jgi:MFS family permease